MSNFKQSKAKLRGEKFMGLCPNQTKYLIKYAVNYSKSFFERIKL